MPGHFDCIVLGAGMAGVTAGCELKKQGKKVLLLEGSSAVGGRMRSKRDFVLNDDGTGVRNGFPVEEGADWIHVADEEPFERFWHEIRQHGFKTDEFPKSARNRLSFRDWVPPLTAADAFLQSASIRQMASKGKGLFGKIRDFALTGQDLPAGQFVAGLGYRSKGLMLAYYSISAHTPGFLDIHPEAIGPETDDISVAGLRADHIPHQLRFETSEFELRSPQGGICGYDELPQAMAKQFTAAAAGQVPGQILFNQEVTKVELENGGGVRVRTSGEAAGFTAATAICTFSVGMLNPDTGKGAAIFGDALLPPAKRAALKIVKMGKITKFMMQFKEWVWRPNRPGFEMGIVSHATGARRREPRTFFCSFPQLGAGPYVLCGLFMGVDQLILESIPDDVKAAEFLFRVIERIYNETPERPWSMEEKLVWRTLPDGTRVPNVYRKNWGDDPWARGGNSYLSYLPGRTIAEIRGAREALKSPLATLPVFWAGEATAPAYHRKCQPLAVHGAFMSGLRVTEDVSWFLNNPNQDFPKFYREKYHFVV